MPAATSTQAQNAIPRILFIDAYDSFANNIIAFLEAQIPCAVTRIRIDDARFSSSPPQKFQRYLRRFAAVVAGPGPGTALDAADVGLISRLWDLEGDDVLPVLGICLGFQSLARACGARIERLREPRHGLITRVAHCERSIFGGTELDVWATQYHSLQARIGHYCQWQEREKEQCGSGPGGLPEEGLWSPSTQCPDLIPLAWDFDKYNGAVLMSVKHAAKPFWGVQYHPESVCTNEAGGTIIRNWWRESQAWQKSSGMPSRSQRTPSLNVKGGYLHPTVLNLTTTDLILLQSGTTPTGAPLHPETGKCSIIGLLHPSDTLRLYYYQSSRTLDVVHGRRVVIQDAKAPQIWDLLSGLVAALKVDQGPRESPFWGGLMGFVSYEAGLATIGVEPAKAKQRRPDMCFAFVTRSVVLDHAKKVAWVQGLRDADAEWAADTAAQLAALDQRAETAHASKGPSEEVSADVDPKAYYTSPYAPTYMAQVAACQSHIRAGSSYELCLTGPTKVYLPRRSLPPPTPSAPTATNPWRLYERLHRTNPAPFSAYLSLTHPTRPDSSLHVLSSSPERFVRVTREGDAMFRPIKGTVAKRPGVTRQDAERVLNSDKERAENLMIVDLIRHDLGGVDGKGVWVEKLMGVEEYETVYQLVSVIRGQLGAPASPDADADPAVPATDAATPPPRQHAPPSPRPSIYASPAVALLAATLPPGSMTGAPKKRSCELLTRLERDRPRGVYSGVLGYLDVGGGADFSVVIRTAWQWGRGEGDDEGGAEFDRWEVAAGGAITALSEEEAEFEEMRGKAEVVVRGLGVDTRNWRRDRDEREVA
ncbi:ADC synthase [Lineolata rhizophorae]|uniref:aminodeoxychorismate synthase n=1 Tax=Lineolata rhizophorae TaxID=578093 RepID=A0A6A6PF28_9PEZI|nr:ADC synthase [Lineolata rhizophorae]